MLGKEILYELCISGVVSAFKYIPFFVSVDFNQLFSNENLDRYDNNVKYILCRYGYLATNSDFLLNLLYNWSLYDIIAYKALIDLYLDCGKKEVLDVLNKNLTKEKSELLDSRINKRSR